MGIPPKTSPENQGGFTLLELLTTIAIIGLLLALTLAGFGKLKNRAASIRDTSNLRQVFSAITLYANDNNNCYIVSSGQMFGGLSTPWWWYGTPYSPGQEATHRSPLMDYLNLADVKQMNLLTIAKANQTSTTQPTSKNAYGFPYTVNYNLMPNTSGFMAVNRSAVTNPSQKILMLDSSTDSWGVGFFANVGLDRIGADSEGKTRALWADGHVTKESKQYILDHAVELISLDK